MVELGRPLIEGRPTFEVHHTTERIETVVPSYGDTVTELGEIELEASEDTGEQQATLMLVSGPTPGQVFTLKPETVIGRDPLADIQIDDSGVSRRHARVLVREGYCIVEDLGSTNGTLVGGAKVAQHSVAHGERIQLGPRVVFRFALLDAAEEKMHRQLFESSTRDALTGAYNKKYITERLVAEVAHALRHDSSLEVVVFDLDRFKQVNDQHGHLVGDAVLRAVSERVHQVVRSEDVFGRFGGEEFVVISRGSDAARLAERIRTSIDQLAIPTEQGGVHVTLSLGVARLDELLVDRSASALLEKADLRLLAAKRAGRNRVCSSD
jgi:two-component system, cell cycle response regulator